VKPILQQESLAQHVADRVAPPASSPGGNRFRGGAFSLVSVRPLLIFAPTILLSAFLLFQIQPLIGKIILPWFGGSAAVWSAALLFFQVFLLAGYAYAHFLIRHFKPKVQMIVHGGLLLVSCVLLPILPSPGWKPTSAADPTFRILALLAVTIGLPYFLLSSTSPLLQAWYVRKTGSKVPYRLFALSNFGSMLGLLSFPFLVEPNLTSRAQAYLWSGAYVGFVLLCILAAWVSRRGALRLGPHQADDKVSLVAGRPGVRELLLWTGLAAVASALLVAITTHLTQNVAPIPLLWVVPLALYLLTFILAFEGDRLYRRGIFVPILLPLLVVMAFLSIQSNVGTVPIALVLPLFTVGLFVCCMVCHGELARRRPAPQHLTLFYLMVSVGGAAGGVFVALVAPRIFDSYLELPIGLVACAVIVAGLLWRAGSIRLGSLPRRAVLVLAVWLTLVPLGRAAFFKAADERLSVRNFYGVLRVVDQPAKGDMPARRRLFSGTVEHGAQYLDVLNRGKPTTYYGPGSGIARAVRAAGQSGPIRVGVVGLGAGVLSTYSRPGDSFTYYEINPEDERIAREQFSFLNESPGEQRVVLGDARLVLERTKPQNLDILVVDAFSGDAVPIHLLTQEALSTYFRHIKPDGMLVLHVSNLYLDLIPVAAKGAEHAGKQARYVHDDGGSTFYPSNWVIITSNQGIFNRDAFADADIHAATAPEGFRGWTDSYSNLLDVISLK
jgi:spermidine synthase